MVVGAPMAALDYIEAADGLILFALCLADAIAIERAIGARDVEDEYVGFAIGIAAPHNGVAPILGKPIFESGSFLRAFESLVFLCE
jgi:hypothetical protein